MTSCRLLGPYKNFEDSHEQLRHKYFPINYTLERLLAQISRFMHLNVIFTEREREREKKLHSVYLQVIQNVVKVEIKEVCGKSLEAK